MHGRTFLREVSNTHTIVFDFSGQPLASQDNFNSLLKERIRMSFLLIYYLYVIRVSKSAMVVDTS